MKKAIIGYVGSGTITQEDAEKLDGINIAFGGLHRDGSVSGLDHAVIQKIPTLRKWNPNLKIVLSMVQEEPDAFTRCCATEELRERAAKALADAAETCDLDGIDLDWEYPCVPSNGSETSPADKHNFTLFCQAIRRELDTRKGKDHYILSIAAGADVYYVNCVELPKLMGVLDYINVMTYDLKCGFHALAGHHTALFSNVGDVFRNSCAQALELFVNCGVKPQQLYMGAAFYSRKWSDLADRNHGLLQISQKGGGYGPDYEVLAAEYIDKNGFTRYWDEEAQAPFLFDGSTFLSYDDPQSLKAKADYVKEKDYAGIFYWEHKCDSTGTLLGTLDREFH